MYLARFQKGICFCVVGVVQWKLSRGQFHLNLPSRLREHVQDHHHPHWQTEGNRVHQYERCELLPLNLSQMPITQTVVAAFTLCKSRTGGREGTWSHLQYCQRLTKESLHNIFPISQPFSLSCHLTVHSLSILTLKRFCFNWTQTWVYPKVI